MRSRWLQLCLLVLLAPACSSDQRPVNSPRSEVLLTYEHEGSIHLVQADGKRPRILQAKREKQAPRTAAEGRFFDAWFDPHLDGTGSTVACVRIVNWSPGVLYDDPAQVDQEQQLAVFDVARENEVRVLHRTRERVSSPTWSPDGQRIAWVEGRTELRCGRRDGAAAVTVAEAGPGRFLAWRWLDDDTLVAARELSTPRGGELIRVHVAGPLPRIESVGAWDGLVAPAALRDDPSSAPVFRALFGAGPDATSRRIPFFVTTDLRYSFTKRKREGILARGWIEGHDAQSGGSFEVRTLWRSLYAE